MASEQLTEYERRRLENIKRNDEMMASLKIHSRLSDLSASSKRHRVETKTFKQSPDKKTKSETPIVIRHSLRSRGMPPDSPGLPKDFNELRVKPSKFKSLTEPAHVVLGPLSMSDVYNGDNSDRMLLEKFTNLARNSQLVDENDDGSFDGKPNADVHSNDPLISPAKIEKINIEDPIDLGSLKLDPKNIARVVPGRIFVVRIFPTTDMTMVVAGDKFGNLGFWDVKAEKEDGGGNGIYLYRPHSAPISGISVQPFCLSKVFTSSYDGLLRLMDVEKEVFDLVYSSSSGSGLFSLLQHPNDVNSIYLGEGLGGLNMFDGRVGKISTSCSLHEGRINSIDFNPANTNIMATSSTDGLACLWDLRKMDAEHPERGALKTVKHDRGVRSAYFSPSGSCLATTSWDDNIGLLQGVNFEETFMIHHDNWTNRWLSSFRAVWGWDDTYLYIGNMKRRVDVVSVAQRKTVYTINSPLMSAIPCRYDAHPCTVGMLAGATGGGQVYLWTTHQPAEN